MKNQEVKNYEEKIAAQIQQKRAEIEKMKAKLSEKKADAKIGYEKNLRELEAKQADLEKRFDTLKASSGAAWTDMKSGFHKAWEELSDSMKEAKEKF